MGWTPAHARGSWISTSPIANLGSDTTRNTGRPLKGSTPASIIGGSLSLLLRYLSHKLIASLIAFLDVSSFLKQSWAS